ncbi:MAG: amidohydrolase [Caldilineaceae bacterium]|nr:amidohydrolase [Caldilineaceae bacterium]
MQIVDLAPDLILTNGRIYTLDTDNAEVSALAVKDGRVIAGGGDDVAALAGPRTEILDLGGRTALPGIFDSHNHLMQVGVKLTRIRLDECTSPAEMMELVRARATVTPPGTWIIGEGWNENNFTDGRLPTRHDIDPATDRHPVILMRFFNMDVINTVGLKLAGVNKSTPDPEGGRIEREADGTPNGILRAAAKLLVRNLIPRPTQTELVEAVRLGCADMHRFGITSVIDPGLMPFEVSAYQAAYAQGNLSVRTNLMLSWHGFREEEHEAELDARATSTGLMTGLGDAWLRLGGLKMAIDGGTSSHTAFMYAPFEGEATVGNFNRLDPAQLRRYFRTAQEHGWDVGIHTCGDRAMDMVVDAFSEVVRELPNPDARHNVIHAYFPSERALDQMGRHNIGAVIQPTFLYWEGDMIFRDVGRDRAANYKPARKFLDHGIPLAANSDIPSTVTQNPFPGLYALVTRRNNVGTLVAPDQALTRTEALHAYTTGGTWLTREETLKGTLTPGKVADICVIDRDYFTVPDAEIKDIQVVMTMVDGRVVYTATA